MTVRDLMNAWMHMPGKVVVSVTTLGNPYGDEIHWDGTHGELVTSDYCDSNVLTFYTEHNDGVNYISIFVDAKSVPVCMLANG